MMTSKFWKRRTVGKIAALHPSTRKPITVDVQHDCMISDLDVDLRRLPGLLAWYLALRDTADDVLREARHAEHNVEEDLNVSLRTGKETETALRNRVKTNPTMREAYRQRMAAERMFRDLKSAVEAVSEKRWALQALVKLQALERGVRDGA